MIHKINFKNYKSFKEQQTLELRPITVIIGKNSSGKSAVVKLPTLLEGALSGTVVDPISIINDGIELGAEFRDLLYGRELGSLEFLLEEQEDKVLGVEIVSGVKSTDSPKIRKWKYNDNVELLYRDHSQDYLNVNVNESCDVKFNGFNIISGISKEKLYSADLFNLRTNYIGPFRVLPKRNYTSIGRVRYSKTGIKGENTYQILISDFLYNESKLLNKVSEWYEKNFDGWGIQVNNTCWPDLKIELTRKDSNFCINLRDVGEGMSQVLPLVVSAFMDNDIDTLTIMEQPELHLHPGAHGDLAELFVTSAMTSNNKFLIETHSQNFVLRLRRLIAERKINKDKVVIYTVNYDSHSNTSSLKEISIDDNGNVEYWPKKVFSETLDETLAIKRAQLKNIKI